MADEADSKSITSDKAVEKSTALFCLKAASLKWYCILIDEVSNAWYNKINILIDNLLTAHSLDKESGIFGT